jgi:hypothetical protein
MRPTTRLQPGDHREQRAQPVTIEHHGIRLGSASPHTSVARTRGPCPAPVGKRHHQEHDPVDALEVVRDQHLADNGCLSDVTRTSHGNTARICCSLSL